MANLDRYLQSLFSLFGRQRPTPEKDPVVLRQTFRKNYGKFRSLLTANNNALELMADMEQTRDSGQPFGMTFVRSRSTAMGVNVFKMIQCLQEISGGKYTGLNEPFRTVSSRTEEILGPPPKRVEGPFIMGMDKIDRHMIDMVGNKMANLGEVGNRADMAVPAGFVITAAAAQHFLTANNLVDEINRRLTICNPDNLEDLYTTSAAIQQLITRAPLPEDLADQITEAYRRLSQEAGSPPLLAMRSSALGEDGGNASFAGQYRTQLNVGSDLLHLTYKEIIAGKYKSQAIVYRLQRGFRHQDVTMCVGCLAMVAPQVSGVIYSRPPGDHRSRQMLISAAAGMASQVVDGRADTDLYKVNREPPHEVLSRELRKNGNSPVLSKEQLRELSKIAVRLESHFGVPQDIEWTIDRQNKIIILQSRPLGHPAEAQAEADKHAASGSGSVLSQGIGVSRGVASGPVFTVRTDLDLLRFPREAILVVEHPLPQWATLITRTAAVISETGQTAAHLATVAREFGIPAIFGATGATAKLKNGQIVTVDATGCRIYDGRQEKLLSAQQQKPNLMYGSPVHNVLSEILKLTVPLNLTDPASVYFRPSFCKTFHDLTRFCHEKAVSEMFSFGARLHFDERAAKRLVGDIPSQWWVIDLDDGFTEEFDRTEKFVSIDKITSAPMLALWQGMTAIPWQGPPPVSLKGFGSILFQSTMNRELDPAVRSGLANRNYFMVSKNFCNLNVRLGYHFALVESHLSELLTENYVSFRFKGGAADEERRSLRVQLLKDILQLFDFRVEQTGDALNARIEKKPSNFLIPRLQMLGYLLIHTRQIDMVMHDRDMVERYRAKILSDISKLLSDRGENSEKGGFS